MLVIREGLKERDKLRKNLPVHCRNQNYRNLRSSCLEEKTTSSRHTENMWNFTETSCDRPGKTAQLEKATQGKGQRKDGHFPVLVQISICHWLREKETRPLRQMETVQEELWVQLPTRRPHGSIWINCLLEFKAINV